MKLELDFTNKVIVVVDGGPIKELLNNLKALDIENWTIGAQIHFQYVPSYPHNESGTLPNPPTVTYTTDTHKSTETVKE